METIDTKALTGFEVKDVDRGEVTAIVSTFNVVDRDGDVILPGAIKDGTVVKLSAYAHDVILKNEPPVGRGVINVKGDRAVFEGRYFMSTPRGRDAFAQVKEMGSESEWSIGFPKAVRTQKMTDAWSAKGARRLISGIDPIETSPVFLGANQYTETVNVKAVEVEAVKQADGDPEPPAVDAKTLGDLVIKEIADRLHAEHLERKAATDAALEAARVDAETKATEAETARKAAELDAATKEFERFQRTMRKFA